MHVSYAVGVYGAVVVRHLSPVYRP